MINKKGQEIARIIGEVNFQDKQFLKWLSYIVMLSQSRQMHVDSNRMNKFIGSKLQKKLERENKTN